MNDNLPDAIKTLQLELIHRPEYRETWIANNAILILNILFIIPPLVGGLPSLLV